jgi:GAF domain-containing protein
MTTPLTDYELIAKQLAALLADESDALAITANFVALLYGSMAGINWLGVYVARGDDLVLGPFQGKPACVHIPFGQGVCGTAAASGEIQRVDDVHEFAGHIACDPASRSEIVIPLRRGERLLGVLDVDSPTLARFDERDQEGLVQACEIYLAALPESVAERFI